MEDRDGLIINYCRVICFQKSNLYVWPIPVNPFIPFHLKQKLEVFWKGFWLQKCVNEGWKQSCGWSPALEGCSGALEVLAAPGLSTPRGSLGSDPPPSSTAASWNSSLLEGAWDCIGFMKCSESVLWDMACAFLEFQAPDCCSPAIAALPGSSSPFFSADFCSSWKPQNLSDNPFLASEFCLFLRSLPACGILDPQQIFFLFLVLWKIPSPLLSGFFEQLTPLLSLYLKKWISFEVMHLFAFWSDKSA